MIAASALILLAEAVTPCAAPGMPRLGGGALLVRPITTEGPVPFIRLGPATHIVTRSTDIQQIGARTGEPEADPSPQQCEPVAIPLV